MSIDTIHIVCIITWIRMKQNLEKVSNTICFMSQTQTFVLFFQVFTSLYIYIHFTYIYKGHQDPCIGLQTLRWNCKWVQMTARFVRSRPALHGDQRAVSTQAWGWLQVLFYGNQDFLFVCLLFTATAGQIQIFEEKFKAKWSVWKRFMQQVYYSQPTEIRKGMGLTGSTLITIWGSWQDSYTQFI